MTEPTPQIVALGGGGFSMEAGNPLLDDYVLGLCPGSRPSVCFLPSASGDADHYIVRFYQAFDPSRCKPSHISLFRRNRCAPDLREHLLAQDVVYVGGGSVISLLGVWRAHGVDEILREAWLRGVILCGVSAGSLCWFAAGVTAFHGEPERVDGLGFLPYSNTVHHDAELRRQSAFRRHLRAGMPAGYAASDGCALRFAGDRLAEVVSSRPRATAHHMRWSGQRIVSTRLTPRYLGEPALATDTAVALRSLEPAATAALVN
jgi:peptidase E